MIATFKAHATPNTEQKTLHVVESFPTGDIAAPLFTVHNEEAGTIAASFDVLNDALSFACNVITSTLNGE